MTTLAFRFCGDWLLVVHGATAPEDAVWDHMLRNTLERIEGLAGVLVFTDGPSPTPAQRARLKATGSLLKLPTALVTSSMIARGVATALSWLGAPIQAFTPANVNEAFEHLGVPQILHQSLLVQLICMRAELLGIAAADELVAAVEEEYGAELLTDPGKLLAMPPSGVRQSIQPPRISTS